MPRRPKKRATATRLPAKSSLRRTADTLWSRAVRNDWKWKCAVCQSSNKLDAHHLIPRAKFATRYLIENGVTLCSHHHQWDTDLSPHLNAAGWMDWLSREHPSRAQWYRDHKWDRFDGTKTQGYFVEVIQSLRAYFEPTDFRDIVGPTLLGHLDRE